MLGRRREPLLCGSQCPHLAHGARLTVWLDRDPSLGGADAGGSVWRVTLLRCPLAPGWAWLGAGFQEAVGQGAGTSRGPRSIPNLQQVPGVAWVNVRMKTASCLTGEMGLLGNGTGIGIQAKQAMASPQASLENTEEVPRRAVRARGARSFSLSLQGKDGAVPPRAEGVRGVDGHLVQPGSTARRSGRELPLLAAWLHGK